MAILALISVCSLTACSVDTSTSFSHGWNPNKVSEPTPGGVEVCEYDVKLEDASNEDFSVSYANGKYVTRLETNPENRSQYIYTTTFTADVTYSYGEEQSDPIQERIVSEIIMDGTKNLRPISSKKIVHSPVALGISPESLEACFAVYSYTMETNYNGSKGTFHRYSPLPGTVDGVNLLPEIEETFSISSKHTYIDNEQLYLCARGVLESSKQTLLSYNTSARTVQKISIAEDDDDTASFTFALNGEEAKQRAIAYADYKVAIQESNPGQTQTLRIATSDAYRRLLLELRIPLSYNLGTLVFTLTNASTIS